MKDFDEEKLREEYEINPKKSGLEEAKQLEKNVNYLFIFLLLLSA